MQTKAIDASCGLQLVIANEGFGNDRKDHDDVTRDGRVMPPQEIGRCIGTLTGVGNTTSVVNAQRISWKGLVGTETAPIMTPVSRGDRTPIERFRPPLSVFKSDIAELIRDITPEFHRISRASTTG